MRNSTSESDIVGHSVKIFESRGNILYQHQKSMSALTLSVFLILVICMSVQQYHIVGLKNTIHLVFFFLAYVYVEWRGVTYLCEFWQMYGAVE